MSIILIQSILGNACRDNADTYLHQRHQRCLSSSHIGMVRHRLARRMKEGRWAASQSNQYLQQPAAESWPLNQLDDMNCSADDLACMQGTAHSRSSFALKRCNFVRPLSPSAQSPCSAQCCVEIDWLHRCQGGRFSRHTCLLSRGTDMPVP